MQNCLISNQVTGCQSCTHRPLSGLIISECFLTHSSFVSLIDAFLSDEIFWIFLSFSLQVPLSQSPARSWPTWAAVTMTTAPTTTALRAPSPALTSTTRRRSSTPHFQNRSIALSPSQKIYAVEVIMHFVMLDQAACMKDLCGSLKIKLWRLVINYGNRLMHCTLPRNAVGDTRSNLWNCFIQVNTRHHRIASTTRRRTRPCPP